MLRNALPLLLSLTLGCGPVETAQGPTCDGGAAALADMTPAPIVQCVPCVQTAPGLNCVPSLCAARADGALCCVM